MFKHKKKYILEIFSVSLLLIFVFGPFNSQVLAESGDLSQKLVERIAKDYTNKFCNSIAFGLSKESAMAFSNKENNLIFKKKKGIDSIDKKLLARKISTLVVETCGYPISLKGEEGINEFEEKYISMN